MEELEKNLERLGKVIDKAADEVVKGVNRIMDEAPTEIKETVRKERNKADLKSQIGTHQRTIDKAYYRLGIARYEKVMNNHETDREEDLIEIINTNQKVIALLKQKLDEVE